MLATSGAAIALALAINQLRLHGLAAPVALRRPRPGLARAEAMGRPAGRLWRPIGYGLVLALLLVETFRLFGAERLFGGAARRPRPGWIALHGPLIGRALTAALLLWVAIALARREGLPCEPAALLAPPARPSCSGCSRCSAPGLASALLILLLGFAAGNRLLIALGILSLLGFVVAFLLQPARHPAREIRPAGGHRPRACSPPVRAAALSRPPAGAAEPADA